MALYDFIQRVWLIHFLDYDWARWWKQNYQGGMCWWCSAFAAVYAARISAPDTPTANYLLNNPLVQISSRRLIPPPPVPIIRLLTPEWNNTFCNNSFSWRIYFHKQKILSILYKTGLAFWNILKIVAYSSMWIKLAYHKNNYVNSEILKEFTLLRISLLYV